jgi:hypothetical protein
MTNVTHVVSRASPAGPDTAPGHGECLPCFVRRMVDALGCTGTLVWVEHWKRARSPRATALVRRLERRGAACDCSLVTVLLSPSPALWEWEGESRSLNEPRDLPPCSGVRPRSTHPCAHWTERALALR